MLTVGKHSTSNVNYTHLSAKTMPMHMLHEKGLMHMEPGDETYISVAKHRMCSAYYLTRGRDGESYCRRSDFEIYASRIWKAYVKSFTVTPMITHMAVVVRVRLVAHQLTFNNDNSSLN
jgi:hypothetical protein